MSKTSESASATARQTSTRRYWRRTASPKPWWPWGLLPLLGLVVLFLFGAMVTAPNIQAEVRSEVAERLGSSEIAGTVVRGDGQGIRVRAVAPEDEERVVRALARSTQCDTWAGPLTCPTTVDVVLTRPQVEAAPLAAPTPAPAATPVARDDRPQEQTATCNDQFDAILSNTQVRFATSSAVIDTGDAELLQRLANVARSCSGDLMIVGHTDSRGAEDANQALSLSRAQAVGDALVQLGIPRDRVSARGAGATNPIADNATPAGRAMNRRIVITVDQ